METLYYERANGTWEAWIYSEGNKKFIGRFIDLAFIEKYQKQGYKIVKVK